MFGRRGKRTDDGDRIGNALREARAWLESSRESQRRTDIEQAVAAGTKALRLCGPEAPERFAALLVLSEARALRHAVTTSIEDLQTAVELHRELVDLSATEHPDMSGPVLRTFAFLSLRLGLLTGGQRHIEDAALTARELDELAERTDSPQFHAVAARPVGTGDPVVAAGSPRSGRPGRTARLRPSQLGQTERGPSALGRRAGGDRAGSPTVCAG